MKVLVERHDHETRVVEAEIKCPCCHSELLINREDLISATFAPMYNSSYFDAIGKIIRYKRPDLHAAYTTTVVQCPVCNSYIHATKDEELIIITDERIR